MAENLQNLATVTSIVTGPNNATLATQGTLSGMAVQMSNQPVAAPTTVTYKTLVKTNPTTGNANQIALCPVATNYAKSGTVYGYNSSSSAGPVNNTGNIQIGLMNYLVDTIVPGSYKILDIPDGINYQVDLGTIYFSVATAGDGVIVVYT